MHYELVSRAVAYLSCLSASSLFAMSMTIAVINVGKSSPLPCGSAVCAQSADASYKPVRVALTPSVPGEAKLQLVKY